MEKQPHQTHDDDGKHRTLTGQRKGKKGERKAPQKKGKLRKSLEEMFEIFQKLTAGPPPSENVAKLCLNQKSQQRQKEMLTAGYQKRRGGKDQQEAWLRTQDSGQPLLLLGFCAYFIPCIRS